VQIRALVRGALVAALLPLTASAALIQLPDITVSALNHSSSITYNGQNTFSVTDAPASWTPATGSTSSTPVYTFGDTIVETFLAPPGMRFVFTAPDFGPAPQFSGHLAASANWAGTGTGSTTLLQTASTGAFAGFQGTSPTLDAFSLGGINKGGGAYDILAPGATFDIKSANSFSFTSFMVTMPVPSNAAGPASILTLNSVNLSVSLGWITNGPQVTTQPDAVFTLQPVPEPTSCAVLPGILYLATRRRRWA